MSVINPDEEERIELEFAVGDKETLVSIVTLTIAVAYVHGIITPENSHYDVLGVQSATPVAAAEPIGDAPLTERVWPLLKRVCDVMQPMMRNRHRSYLANGRSMTRWLPQSIFQAYGVILEESAHRLIEMQPEARLEQALIDIGIPAGEAAALVGAI
jgi:hypothetical protein